MQTTDLKILQSPPNLSTKATLIIEPLAPLSMVNDLPGSFYKSLKSPSKKMLCGLFENILGWHFSFNHRTAIQKEIIQTRRKQKIDYAKPQTGSTYIPLLMEYFEIDLVTIPEHFMYNDLWNKSYRRADADVHPKGTQNIHYDLIPLKRDKPRDPKKPKQIANAELLKMFLENQGKFPLYYSTPTTREYINHIKPIVINLLIDKNLQDLINKYVNIQSVSYLGNSEGWIELKLYSNEK